MEQLNLLPRFTRVSAEGGDTVCFPRPCSTFQNPALLPKAGQWFVQRYLKDLDRLSFVTTALT